MFDFKTEIKPGALWQILGSFFGFISIVVTTIVKTVTRNYATKKEIKELQSKEMCTQKYNELTKRIDNLQEHISERFDDLKDFIVKNGFKK